MSIWIPVILASISLVGGSASTVLGYLWARQRYSGRVDTTDADALWKEAASMRRDMGTELAQLRSDLIAAKHERESVLHEMAALKSEHVREMTALRAELAHKDEQIETLTLARVQLTQRVTELEAELRRATRYVPSEGGSPA